MLWNILEYIMCLIEFALLYNFCIRSHKLDVKFGWISRLFGTFLVTCILFIYTYIDLYSFIKMVICLVVFIAYVTIFFKDTIRSKLTTVLLFYFLLGFCDFIVTILTSKFYNQSILEVISFVNSRLMLFVVSKIILALLISILSYFKNDNKISLPIKYWIVFLTLFSFLIIALLFMAEIGVSNHNFKFFDMFLIGVNFVFVIIYFAIYFLFYQLCNYFSKINELNLINYQLRITEKHLIHTQISNEKIKELSHDLKHSLIYWKELAENNNNGILSSQLEEYEKNIEHNSLFDLGNSVVNAIINEKAMYARKNNINLKVNGGFDNNIIVSSIDLCSLLGNVIDNAIEACIKIKDIEKRKIEISFKKDNLLLFFETKNSYEIEPFIKNNVFASNKHSSLHHGIGILSINNIINKYQGGSKYYYKDNEICLFIFLQAYS